MKTYVVVVILIIALPDYIWSQQIQDTLAVQVIARSFEDSIMVRWAPINYHSWKHGNDNGYQLSRVTIKRNGQLLSAAEQTKSVVRLPDVFKPAPPAIWKPMIETNEFAGVAAGAIYGEDFSVPDLENTDLASIINTTQERQSLFGFSLFAADQDITVAAAMGLLYVDRNIKSNEAYYYQIELINTTANEIVFPTGILISTLPLIELSKPLDFKVEFGDKQALLQWNHVSVASHYTSYIIERSPDGGKTFERQNEYPVVHTASGTDKMVYYLNKLPANFKNYSYRVRGLSPFGIYGTATDSLSGEGIPKPIKADLPIREIIEIKDQGLQLRWEFPDSLNAAIDGFDIYRTRKIGEPWEKINTAILFPTDRQYLDPLDGGSAYYRVVALDKNGYELSSFEALGQLSDAIPPAPPIGLEGEIDKEGLVTLKWQGNKEADLMGYRVLMSNTRGENYVQMTAKWVADSTYRYTINLNALNDTVYYKVLALDFRENYSEHSDVLAIARPDIIPPIAPLFSHTKATSEGIELAWILSTSEDVAFHQLQRRVEYERHWDTLLVLTGDSISLAFIDTTASYKYTYQYRLMAQDSSENTISSTIIKSKPIDTGLRGTIGNLTGTADRRAKLIELTWDYEWQNAYYEFHLLRAKNEAPLTTYQVISATELSKEATPHFFQLKDTTLKRDTNYRYQLMAKHEDGGFSNLSAEIVVEY